MTTFVINGTPVVPPAPSTPTPVSVTVADLIKDALGLCGATEIDETPSSSDMAISLRALNMMLNRWSTQNLLVRSNTAITFSTQAGKASYTIGPVVGASTADVTSSKPLRISSGFITLSGVDYPLEVWTREMYDNLFNKDVSTGLPMYVVYDPNAAQQSTQRGTLYLYYTPDRVYTVTLEAFLYLTEFSTFTEAVTFEPAYYEAIVYNLAVRLFRRFNDAKAQIPVDVAAIAAESLRNLRTLNSERTIALLDIPGVRGVYNVYADEYK